MKIKSFMLFLKEIKENKYFLQYVIVNITLLVFMVYISIAIIYKGSVNNSIKDAINARMAALSQTAYQIDSMIGQIKGVSNELSGDTEVNKWLLRSPTAKADYFNIAQIYEKINNMINSHDIIHSIYIYNNRNKKFISNFHGYKDFTEVQPKGWEYVLTDPPAKETVINSKDIHSFILYDKVVDTLSFIYTAPVNRNLGAIAVNIPESLLLSSVNLSQDEEIYIINSVGSIISHKNKELLCNNLSDKDYNKKIFLSQSNHGSFTHTIDGTEYAFFYQSMNSANWTVVSTIPYNTLTAKSQRLKINLVIILFICIVAGLLVTLFITGIMFKPINRMIDHMRKSLKPEEAATGQSRKIDEIAYLSNSLELLFRQKTFYEKAYNDNYSAIHENYIRNLLYGRIKPSDKHISEYDFLSSNPETDNFMVFILSIDNYFESLGKMDHSSREEMYIKIIGLLQNFISPHFKFYIVQTEQHSFSVLLNCGNIDNAKESAHKTINSLLSSIIGACLVDLKLSMTVGAGNAYTNLDNIPKSYEEAVEASKHKLFLGKGSVIHYKDIETDTVEKSTPKPDKARIFADVLRTRSIDDVNALLDSMILSELNESKSSADSVNLLFYKLVSVIASICVELQSTPAELYNEDVFLKLHYYETIEEKKKYISLLSEKLVELRDNEKKANKQELIKNIIDFITENYSNPDISLNVLADEVFFSTSYISRLIKDELGVSFNEYLNNLRIEKSVELLKKNHSIKDVSEKTGYNSVHSFIRNFKKVYSITPSEYKNQHLR